MPKELTMATISHHAVTRHQNQRTRYSRPVPAPTCRMMSKLSLAVSSAKTSADETHEQDHRGQPSGHARSAFPARRGFTKRR